MPRRVDLLYPAYLRHRYTLILRDNRTRERLYDVEAGVFYSRFRRQRSREWKRWPHRISQFRNL